MPPAALNDGGLLFGALIRGHARARLVPLQGEPVIAKRGVVFLTASTATHVVTRAVRCPCLHAIMPRRDERQIARPPPIYIRHDCKMQEWDREWENGTIKRRMEILLPSSANPISVLASYCSDSNQCSVSALWKFEYQIHLSFPFG